MWRGSGRVAKFYVVPAHTFPVGLTAASGSDAFCQIFGLKSNPNQIQLSNMHANTSYGASIVTNPVASGRPSPSALRLEIRTQNDKATPSLDRPRAQLYTYDVMSAWRKVHWHTICMMVPTSYSGHNGSWFGLFDFHGINSAGLPLEIWLIGSGSSPQIRVRSRNDFETSTQNLGDFPITKGQYFTLTFRLVWDSRSIASGGTGRITIYKDGSQVLDVARPLGSNTDETVNWPNTVPYLKVGPQIDPNTSSGYPFVFYYDLIMFGDENETLSSMLPTFVTANIPVPWRQLCGCQRWEKYVGADTWNGDCFYKQVTTRTQVVSTTNAVANTTEDFRYQKARRATGSGTIEYEFQCANGNYQVVCGFNDFLSSGVGQRVFNVVLNGSTAESNLDVYSQAGGANRALNKSYNTTVSGGVFNLKITGSTDKFINNFAVIASGEPPATLDVLGFNLAGGTYATEQDLQFTGKGALVGGGTDPNVKVWYTLDGSPVVIGTSPEWVSGNIHLVDGTYNINVLQSDPEGVNTTSALSSLVITIDTASDPPVAEIQVECGQTSGSPPSGWVLDAYYSGANPAAYTSPTGIAGVPSGLLESSFQSIRYSAGIGAALQYILPIENGDVEVRLLLCEVSTSQNYKYKVKLQGEGTAGAWTRLGTTDTYTTLDPLTIVGRFSALVVTREATVSDGTLTLEWEAVSGTAGLSVAGIQVLLLPPDPPDPPPPPEKLLICLQ